MPVIVFLFSLEEEALERVRRTVPGWTVVHGKSAEQWGEALPEAEIVVGWRKDAAETLVRSGTKLKWVQSFSAGVDNMPLDVFKSRQIVLTTASGVHAYPISETVFAMMLAWTRRLHAYVRNQADKRWHHAGLRLELHGKTLLIAGVGAIGEEIARIAKAFGMTVIGVRRSGASAPGVDTMVTTNRLVELLPQADYVVNALPYTQETHRLFDRNAFRAMKPRAFFVNIGRGRTVDTDALVEALREKTIGGAGLDVFEQEPLPPEHPLWDMEEVIITPHSAGSTEAYDDRALAIFLQNLEAYVSGEQPSVNRVRYDLAY